MMSKSKFKEKYREEKGQPLETWEVLYFRYRVDQGCSCSLPWIKCNCFTTLATEQQPRGCKERIMSTSQNRFQAVTDGSNNKSSMMADVNEAITWAREYMTKNPNCTCIRITEDIALVERDTPPIKITPLPRDQESFPDFFINVPKDRFFDEDR